uniref:Uncharacterized protein n=1 Tax=Anguilla anguilla TaxID=7936 RepID=A0A0E9V888_ANGAN
MATVSAPNVLSVAVTTQLGMEHNKLVDTETNNKTNVFNRDGVFLYM